MTSLPGDTSASPWLSVWLRPRDTIARILATSPRRHVLLLAALSAISGFTIELIAAGFRAELLDWRIIAALAFAGAVLGIVSLYVDGLFFRWSGRLFGGHASQAQLRAVLAWGGVPAVIGLVIAIFALLLFKLDPAASGAPTVVLALRAIAVLYGLWSIVLTLLMLSRAQNFGFWRTLASGAVGWLLAALLLAIPLIIRIFIAQPFNTPSGSMMPTLLLGDHFFVSKSAYGYTRFSFPFSPRLFTDRILGSPPQRGDVVVFRLPKDEQTDYIKRVVGLPGDRIQMRSGVLHINGAPVKRERIDDFVYTESGNAKRARRYRETLPNGVSYETLDIEDKGYLDNTQEFRVPLGHYFMLGDNRDNSVDSRVLNQIGYVPFENVIGRAAMLYFSVDREADTNSPRIRFERLGAVPR